MSHTPGKLGRCSEIVSGTGRFGAFHQHQCSLKAVIERDGKLYCKIHDPIYLKEKREKQEKVWKLEREQRENKFRLEQSAPELLEACKEALIYIQGKNDNEEYYTPKIEGVLQQAIAKAEGK